MKLPLKGELINEGFWFWCGTSWGQL